MNAVRPLVLIVLAGLSGCVTVPTSDAVSAAREQLPEGWRSLEASSERAADAEQWWNDFADPTLRMLIERALTQNNDLRAAVERSRQAEAFNKVARSALYPTLDLGAQASRQRTNVPPPAGTSTDASAGVIGAWTIDIFGANQLAALAASAQAQATEESRRDFEVALTANVATAYVQLRGLQRQLEILNENIVLRADTLHLTRVRYDAGLATDLDVARAETQLQQLQAEVPEVQRQIENDLGLLSILAGEVPQAVDPSLRASAPIPSGSPALPDEAPATLLERRPDVRAALRRIDAATANLGSAHADLLPKFTLSFAGFADRLEFRDLPSLTDNLFHLGLGTFWPLFNAGRIRAEIAAADSAVREAEYEFDQTLLNALQDVETAYTNVQAQRERHALLHEAVDSAQRSSALAEQLYAAGTADFLSVLDAHTIALANERLLAEAQTNAAASSVALYRALGGGWRAGGSELLTSADEPRNAARRAAP